MDTGKIMHYIAQNTDFTPLGISVAGKGASACVYKISVEESPYILAVKCSNNAELLKQEYELFALTVGGSKKLKLYENYKNRIVPTEYCDLKVEMYALYNELLWYKKLGSISKNYLLYRSGRLIKQMKRKGLL